MQSTTILVVDDESPILDLIASYLRAVDYSNTSGTPSS